MYLLYHAIFICVVNVHRRQSYQLKEWSLKLRTFIASLSEGLISAGKASRGQLNSLLSPFVKKTKVAQSQPHDHVRRGEAGHLPLETTK